MKPDRALFYLCSFLWIINGVLWQTLDGHSGLAITSMLVALASIGALKLTGER
jgi:hypothetical protein